LLIGWKQDIRYRTYLRCTIYDDENIEDFFEEGNTVDHVCDEPDPDDEDSMLLELEEDYLTKQACSNRWDNQSFGLSGGDSQKMTLNTRTNVGA
jgi:hypothetical protein